MTMVVHASQCRPHKAIAVIYLDLPTGDGWGWGILGDNLVHALAALSPIERVHHQSGSPRVLDGPLLQRVSSDFRADKNGLSPTRRVGYAVFTKDLQTQRAAAAAPSGFDAIAVASRWCEDVLRDVCGTVVAVVHHGVDTARFNPHAAARTGDEKPVDDRFTVFSGGKFEFRKGQDIVVRAFKAFSERHDDVRLLAAWHNASPRSAKSMSASPYYPYERFADESFQSSLRRWLAGTGVDERFVELVARLPNAALAPLYGRSHVGLFPNRCEGGTNLVLMEYMACGRTVIATDFSGHRDVLTEHNSLMLRAHRPLPIVDDDTRVAVWCEPNLEEIVEGLELAYRERDRLDELARQAAADLLEWTWERTATRFMDLMRS